MRALSIAAVVGLLALASCGSTCSRNGRAIADASPGQPSGPTSMTLDVGGRKRDYIMYVPPSAASSAAAIPLVVSLHGGGGRAEGVERQTGWTALADREGFAVVYPNGVGKSWNDGRSDTPSEAVRENVDDVTFIAAVIEDASKRVKIDRRRVYMNGISNGAFMSSRFACERADMIAAIGLVAATIGPDVLARCKPSRPVSVIAFSGTADPLVPFEGGAVHIGAAKRGLASSFADMAKLWTSIDACPAAGVESRDIPDIDRDDGSTVRLDAHTCAGGAAVHLYTIAGGGHTWPGGRQYLPKAVVGTVNRDVDATRAMWAFFAAHPAP